MPDFGQHSGNWCWVAAAANCFYWLKHHGGFPNLYPDSWDGIDPESQDTSNHNWYCNGCDNGYRTLLKEICKYGNAVHEETLAFCSRFFLKDPGWRNYVDLYVQCLEWLIEDQGFADRLEVHKYDNPTFEDYKREINARSCVIILYQWGEPEDIHLVTGVSFDTDKSPPEIEVSDPGTPLHNGSVNHNNNPNLKVYDKWEVTSEDPFEANQTYTVRYLFCISPPWSVDDDEPADFTTIQEAINNANSGDTIIVKNGTYYGPIVVNKTLTLLGENMETTIIDGNHIESVIYVTADNVVINGFTIQNSSHAHWMDSGILVSSNGNEISCNTIQNNHDGIGLYYSDNNKIASNTFSSNDYRGIWLYESENNNVLNNVVAILRTNHPTTERVYLYKSSNNILSGNTITSNDTLNAYGIRLKDSDNNTVTGNIISNNHIGIALHRSNNNTVSGNIVSSNIALGVWINTSSYNTVYRNDIANNGNDTTINDSGVFFWEATNNSIYRNRIANNRKGILLAQSSNDNSIHHNNFIENLLQAHDSSWDNPDIVASNSIWDAGYPSGGNYWDDYIDVDFYSGPNQDVLGSDGIWDHPYIIDVNNKDRYPLVGPWAPIPGDVNGDGGVDVSDLFDFSKTYGSTGQYPNCDFNADNKVDVEDLYIFSKNYGKTV